MNAPALPVVHPMVPALCRITRVVREIEDVFTLHLDVSDRPAGFAFRPGQFNMLYLPGAGEVPISISGDPADPGDLVHTIRAVGSVTRVMERLGVGDSLGVRGPFGTAWPLDEAYIDYVEGMANAGLVNDTSFAGEFVDSFELGTKTTWLGGKSRCF